MGRAWRLSSFRVAYGESATVTIMAKYTAGMNEPGYLPSPDNVEDFDTFDDAKEYVKELLDSDAEYAAMGGTEDDGDALIEDIDAAILVVNEWKYGDYGLARGGEWTCVVGGYAYWISLDPEQD